MEILKTNDDGRVCGYISAEEFKKTENCGAEFSKTMSRFILETFGEEIKIDEKVGESLRTTFEKKPKFRGVVAYCDDDGKVMMIATGKSMGGVPQKFATEEEKDSAQKGGVRQGTGVSDGTGDGVETEVTEADGNISGQKEIEPESIANTPVRKRKGWKTIKRFLTRLGIFIIAMFILFGVGFGVKRNVGVDMFPAVRDGDLVMYSRLQKDYALRDVIAYEDVNGEICFGRIVGRPGDIVEFTEDGRLMLNNTIQSEDVQYETLPAEDSDVVYPYTLGADEYFVLNDARAITTDSRTFGSVKKSDTRGIVMLILRVRGF